MLYALHDAHRAALFPLTLWSEATRMLMQNPLMPAAHLHLGRSIAAGADVFEGLTRRRGKPAWNLPLIAVGTESLPVEETLVLERPFGNLVRFAPPVDRGFPKVLLVAPMSGHYATLLRGTVARLVEDHDVYVTDWKNARDIPLSKGRFGIEEYVAYLLEFIRLLGPEIHMVAVCQPAPLVLAAVSLLSAEGKGAEPRSMTLMGGPIDTRAAATVATDLAQAHPLSWFEEKVVTDVPAYYRGRFRRGYPGFMQLTAFLSMNASRHVDAHISLYDNLVRGDGDSVEAHKRFYDEYLSVCDISADFYLDTIRAVFQESDLPRGVMTWRGVPVEPAAITRTALMTVEGELDDISAPGQTVVAHDLCSNLSSDRKTVLLQEQVGHYGIFNGRRWRTLIAPRIAQYIREQETR
jgi:poly(3-hydroxybutyrate) depolymerase